MNLNQLTLIQTSGLSLILKASILIVLGGMEVFLFVVLSQIRSMNTIVTQPDMFPYLQSFVFFLGICVIALFVAALVIL